MQDGHTPEVVAGEDVQTVEYHQTKFQQSLELIDTDLNVQVFNGPNSDERMNLDIKKLKQLGGGAQADVYQCKIKGLIGKYADKVRKVYNNKDLAH